jgi:hypothetical protein
MIGPVLDAAPSRLDNHRGRTGLACRDGPRFRGIPALALDEDERAAAAGSHEGLEPFVVLGEYADVVPGGGADVVPPHLVRPVDGVDDRVEDRTRVGRPGQPVVAALYPFRPVGPGGQVADAELVDLVAVEVGRVGEQPPVRADLPDAERHVIPAAVRVVQQQVLIQQDLLLTPGQRAAAELLVVEVRQRPGEVVPPAELPAGRFLGRCQPGRQLRRQRVPQRCGMSGLLVVVRALVG